MNYTDYSSHFGKDRFMACISHNDYNYQQLDKRKSFLSNLSLNVDIIYVDIIFVGMIYVGIIYVGII